VNKFKFPLDRVRQFRKLQLEQEQAKLEGLRARLREIDAGQAELRRLEGEASREILSSTSSAEHEGYESHRNWAARAHHQFGRLRAEAQSSIQGQQAAVVEARRRHEMLERCRERALDRWRDDYFRELEALSSELFLARWGR
jgi:hypothetical protein